MTVQPMIGCASWATGSATGTSCAIVRTAGASARSRPRATAPARRCRTSWPGQTRGASGGTTSPRSRTDGRQKARARQPVQGRHHVRGHRLRAHRPGDGARQDDDTLHTLGRVLRLGRLQGGAALSLQPLLRALREAQEGRGRQGSQEPHAGRPRRVRLELIITYW